ncbi:MAG: hypothetical protein ACT4NY_34140 [Pseudonocardiales bacterium]
MKILALAAVILATTGTTSECGAELPKSCTVLFRGLKVESGQITDVLRPVCDPEHLPQNHKIHAWIEHKAFGGEWKQASGRTPIVFDIPDEEGFDIKVSTKCKEGAYRSGYEAIGRGPALPDNPSDNPFKHQDYGWTTHIFSAGDCTG